VLDNETFRTRRLPSFRQVVRHHWPLVALCALGGTAAAALYTTTVESSYTSAARILLYPTPGNSLTPEAASGSGLQLTTAMQTESGIVQTPEVSLYASTELGRDIPAAGEHLAVDVPGGTQVVEIAFTSTSPERATQGARAMSEAFLTYRSDRAETSQGRLLENLRSQASTADANLRRATSDATADPSDSYAVQEVQLFTDRLAQLNDRISAAEVVSTDPGRIIKPAEAPPGSNELPAWVLVLAGAVIGTLGGLAMALLSERRRDLVREDEQTDVGGVPVFATLPWNDIGLVVGHNLDPASREAYRRLRAGVVANGPRPHVLAVAAVDAQSRSSVAAANLAVALAEARYAVLAISADPEDRGIEGALGVPISPGLSELVNDELDVKKVLVQAQGVAVLPGGAQPATVRELYAGPVFRQVVDALREDYDYVILGAAGAGTGDGDAVIGIADSVLVTVTSSQTTHGQVKAALDRFGRLGIHTLGAVMYARPNRDGSRREVADASKAPVAHRPAPELSPAAK
jgi:Mrp family chromosome partitioning ATPase/capsular polysaccharide biosynthesis protein